MEEMIETTSYNPDGFETLAMSLQSAVKMTFELSDEAYIELKNVESKLEERKTYEMWLNRLRLNQESGLKAVIADALCSGDACRIEDAHETAQWHAKNRFITNLARSAIKEYMLTDIRRKYSSNSTMSLRRTNRLHKI